MIVQEYNLEIGCRASNKKTKVIETDDGLLLLKSYDTFITLFDTNKKFLINNIDWFKSSATTRKHFAEFVRHLKWDLDYEIKNECFLYNKQFYELVEISLFNDLGNIDVKIGNILKEYELEQNLIDALVNYDFNLNENYKCNIGSWNTVDYDLVELKTRNKEIYRVELNQELAKPRVEVILTTDKKRTKLLGSKVKLISKSGLSYNDYNTKELNYFTGYDIDY